jgi:glyoxylase-like metal-dependent hydrolase (beta-lactamase superfamily II)
VNGARLYLFECGVLRGNSEGVAREVVGRRLAKAMTDAGAKYAWPVPWYLVTHPDGHVLIDGGNSHRCATDARAHLGSVTDFVTPVMAPAQSCVPVLESHGIDPANIRYILQSHLHWDHTGALATIDSFKNAKVVVSRSEYEYAVAPERSFAGGYVSADFVKEGVPWLLLEEGEDGLDLLGDGTVRIWRSPGHSVGHASFEINLDDSGTILLSGDLANTLDHWNGVDLPGYLTSGVELARSLERMRRLAREQDATLIFGHDPEHWPDLKHAPSYYG